MSLLETKNINVIFQTAPPKQALKNVSFKLDEGEILGIVGESGSGKSTLARVIAKLQTQTSGEVYWRNKHLADLGVSELMDYRRQVQMVFQDPLDALNPRMTIREVILEPVRYLTTFSKQEIQAKLERLLQTLGLSEEHLQRYPHEFSGGQCQRIGIARAMMVQPKLLICDEPVSALDVSVQAQIINLLKELKQQYAMTQLFISHDMGIVRHLCDRVLVLYQGGIVETGDVDAIFENPQHDYTKRLLSSVPLLNPVKERQRIRQWKMT